MLSRVADSFFWMRRYLERAEHSARVIDVYLGLALDDPTDRVGQALLKAVAEPPAGSVAPLRAVANDGTRRAAAEHAAAVAGCVVAARENARQIREQISGEMWEQLNRLYFIVRDLSPGADGAFLRAVVDGAHLFHGVTEATLSHGEGWHYMQLGRYLERATNTAGMLAEQFRDRAIVSATPSDTDYAEWVGLLRASAALEAYTRAHTAAITPERLLEFLLLNAECPRSVRFAAERIEDSLRGVGRVSRRGAGGKPERLAGRLRASLSFGTIDEIIEEDLVRYVAGVRRQCELIHAALFQTYIAYPIESAIA